MGEIVFSFRVKLILAFMGFGFMLIAVSSFLFFKTQQISLKESSIDNAKKLHSSLDQALNFYLQDINDVFNTLEHSLTFQNYLNDPLSNKKSIKQLFFLLASSSGKYMQIRYITKDGMEKIRVDRTNQGDHVFIISDKQLQNKKSRYYFRQGIMTEKLISYSNIDLNIEYGVIEKPVRPVFRITRKVLHKDQLTGILVINVFMENILKQLKISPNFNVYLIDKNGNFILHPDNDKAWNHYFNTDSNLNFYFPEDAACILNNSECQTKELYAKNIISLANPNALKLIIQPKIHHLKDQMYKQFEDIFAIYLFVLLLSFPIAYLFSITPSRLKREVDELNDQLEHKVAETLDELKENNKNLEKNIFQRTKELEEANVKLYQQATIDFLTQIPNRRYFMEMSERYMQLSHRKNQVLSFIIFDIDFFKKVNDTHGHNTGDKVLQFIVKNISSLLRRSDIFGRIGGEEFAIVLLDADLDQAAKLAEKLRLVIQDNTFKDKDITINLTISLGVAQAVEGEQEEVSHILSIADEKLYKAKESGRNKVIA